MRIAAEWLLLSSFVERLRGLAPRTRSVRRELAEAERALLLAEDRFVASSQDLATRFRQRNPADPSLRDIDYIVAHVLARRQERLSGV